MSPGEWDAVFAVNVGGVVNGLRAFVDPDRPLRAFGRVGVTAELVENSHPRMLA